MNVLHQNILITSHINFDEDGQQAFCQIRQNFHLSNFYVVQYHLLFVYFILSLEPYVIYKLIIFNALVILHLTIN